MAYRYLQDSDGIITRQDYTPWGKYMKRAGIALASVLAAGYAVSVLVGDYQRTNKRAEEVIASGNRQAAAELLSAQMPVIKGDPITTISARNTKSLVKLAGQ